MLNLWPLILALVSQTMAGATTNVMPGCPEKCGDVLVPYPFGINFTSKISNPSCALNSSFFFSCNQSFNPPRLFFGENMPIHNISVEEGTISAIAYSAFKCYNESGLNWTFSQDIGMGNGPFRFSDTRNKLTVIGCDTLALMKDAEGSFGSGCVSLCDRNVNLQGSCSGFGCCQIAVPQSVKRLKIELRSPSNHSRVLSFNPCEFAFLADLTTFDVSKLQLSASPISPVTKDYVTSDVVIEWVVREETCEVAQSSSNPNKYACGSNSKCTHTENGKGYRCICKDGFTGNPYLQQGCQDIDECQEPGKYRCQGTCRNTIGNYTCKCPIGMRGDGKVGCRGLRITIIAAIVGGALCILIMAFLIVILSKRRRNDRNFLKNGGLLLKHQSVRIFREAELEKATKNYDQSLLLGEGGFGYVYKGVLADNTQIAVKKPKDKDKPQINQEFQKEIGIVSQINHRNVVKVLGLCMETKAPLLVYEFISNGTLFEHIHGTKSNILNSWKNRLRIAAEAALALDYLHSLADPPIIHGDVKSSNMLLDENYTAKVSDFGASVLISPDKSDMVTKIQGTFGYLDPEYLMTGDLTEKSDVYSFGVVLVELLTGEKPNSRSQYGEKSNIVQYFLSSLENNDISRVLCFEVANEREMDEIEHFAELAKQCLHNSGRKRPIMKEVAEELGRLRKLYESSRDHHQSPEETQHLLGESSYSSIYIRSPKVNQQDIFSTTTFEVEFSTDSI